MTVPSKPFFERRVHIWSRPAGPILFVHTAQQIQYMSQLTTSCVVRLRSRISTQHYISTWRLSGLDHGTHGHKAPAHAMNQSHPWCKTSAGSGPIRGKRATTDREDHRSIRVCSLDNNGSPEQEKIRPPNNQGRESSESQRHLDRDSLAIRRCKGVVGVIHYLRKRVNIIRDKKRTK